MRGKEKCKALKEIRRQIAEENDIPYVVSQCNHQGECKGTCPKCESELRYLERELAIRQGLGKAVAVVGISASVCAGLTACSPVDAIRNMGTEEVELNGDVRPVESRQEDLEVEGETQIGDPDSPAPEKTEETGEAIRPEEAGESETDIQMGEVLPAEETEELATSELAGDIAIIEENGEEMP